MHQVGQLGFVRQLAPASRKLVRRCANVVLVGFHLRSKPVIFSHGQHAAINVHQLAAAEELQADAQPIGQFVSAGLLDVRAGDRLQAVADVLVQLGGGPACQLAHTGATECRGVIAGHDITGSGALHARHRVAHQVIQGDLADRHAVAKHPAPHHAQEAAQEIAHRLAEGLVCPGKETAVGDGVALAAAFDYNLLDDVGGGLLLVAYLARVDHAFCRAIQGGAEVRVLRLAAIHQHGQG